MDQDLIAYSEEIAYLFKSIQKKFKEQFMQQFSNYNFTMPQLMLLHELYHHPGITLNELSEKLGLAKSTVSGIVDRLEVQGVVNRERPENNRRIVKISLTSKMETTENLRLLKTRYLASIFEKVEKEEIEKILYGLKKLDSLTQNIKNDKK